MPTNLRLPFDEPDEAPPVTTEDVTPETVSPVAEPEVADPVIVRDERARAHAIDPSRNVVLEASAGTGKTRVLVTRYVNLLRAGVDPANILAMTFTRKAAAEMRERIVAMLKELATTSRADATRWRDLRDRLGDIAISTIDAFCFSLLREFPLEADLDPGFQIADETMTPRLADEALDGALRVGRRLAAKDPDVELVMARLGERRLRAGLAALLDRRLVAVGALRRFLSARPGPSPNQAFAEAFGRLRGILASPPADLRGFLADGPVQHPAFSRVRADLMCLEGGLPPAPRAWLERLSSYFLSKEGTPRQRLMPPFKKDDCPNAAAYKRHAQAMAAFAPYVETTLATFDRDLNLAMARGVARLYRVARWRYHSALEQEAAVDFSDGLARALALLRRMDEFAQSRYRLEARYHHVLVDEFQDTSRAQWRLVARLVQSWGEGMGLAQDAPLQPSIFVVGDRKQSIYAFRDADVRMLGRARRHISALRPGGDVRRTISRSFRSDPALLAFANDLFANIAAADRPDAFRYRPGDRFPLAPTSTTEPRDVLGLVVGDTQEQAATALADEVERLLATGTVHDRRTGLSRAAAPGDIAILFRSRESHRVFESALEARGVRTYVYKGLGFFDADEVKDLVALLRYLADPASEVRAGAFLRSRLVRLSDAGLQRLAPHFASALSGRDDKVVDRLDEEDRRVLAALRRSARGWLGLVDRLPPAEVLDRVLEESAYAFELRGPRLLQARENLKKVRALTRRLQNAGYCTLGRVADHLERLSGGDESNAVIDAADAVNLMTVHAAKGLEFPIVFVVNLTRGTGGGSDPILVMETGRQQEPLISIGGQLPEASEAVRARDLEETKRLLYVAVTRARERLYLSAVLKNGKCVPGTGSLAEVMPASIFGLFSSAAQAEPGSHLAWAGEATATHAFRVCRSVDSAEEKDVGAGQASSRRSVVPQTGHSQAVQAQAHDESPLATEGRPRHDFLPLADLGGEPRVGVTAFVASRADGVPSGSRAAGAGARGDEAQLVGTLVHRLFQAVGATPVDGTRLRTRAESLLSPEEQQEALAADVVSEAVDVFTALRSRPEVADLLAIGESLFEVPFSIRKPVRSQAAGRTPHADANAIVRGSIDWLVLRPDGGVCVVEIKTGRAHDWHRAQLAVYVDAARALFPGADVEGRILYAMSPDELNAPPCNRVAPSGV